MTPPVVAETVRVPRDELELILERYAIGNTNRDEASDFALAALYNALGPARNDGSRDA